MIICVKMFTYCRLTFLSILISFRIQVHDSTEMLVIVFGAKYLPPLENPQFSFSFIFIKFDSLQYLKSNLFDFLCFDDFVVYFYKLINFLRRWNINTAMNCFTNKMTSPESISQIFNHFLDWLIPEQICTMPEKHLRFVFLNHQSE